MFKKSCVLLMTIALLAGAALPAAALAEGELVPIVYGIDTLSGIFNPFFARTAYDIEVTSLTQVPLLTMDRSGGIVYDAIEGETRAYNGVDYTYHGIADVSVDYNEAADITTYTATLRNDIVFSDGVPLTADDLIFTYYVYLDPSYSGPTQLDSFNIVGVEDYRTQTTAAVHTKYAAMAAAIYAAGRNHVWSASDAWSEALQTAFWQMLEDAWKADVQNIITECLTTYSSNIESNTGITAEVAIANEGYGVIAGMALWGFGSMNTETGIFTTAVTKTEYDTNKGEFPTLDDFYNETVLAYGGDPVAYAAVESPYRTDVLGEADNAFISAYGPMDESISGGIPNISGIRKLNDYTVEVKTTGYEAPAAYSIFGVYVVPMHYYGSAALYDYANNKFGFPFGDLTSVQEKTDMPAGAGAYKFVKYEEGVVYYEANELYYKGAPLTKYFRFRETESADAIPDITTTAIDAIRMPGVKIVFESIGALNTNGELTGDVITTSKEANRGYGYIGINAANVSVGGKAGSEASKNLRKALATILAVHRAATYDSFFGESASVIQYPISSTSWAAPQPNDPDYTVTFSKDVNGNAIYTAGMTSAEAYTAAIEAAKGFLIAAGFTYNTATGIFTAAPAGAKLSYEVIVAGDGMGDHPSFGVLTAAQKDLDSIGISLVINDPEDGNVLWDALDAGTAELWCAAWQSAIDPDMYQIYHSSNAPGMGGSNSNLYVIKDDKLDKLIVDARRSDDQAERKPLYKQALDIILDWAVEVPAYQRQNCAIFSTLRLDIDSITPAITTYWGWLQDIEKLRVKQTPVTGDANDDGTTDIMDLVGIVDYIVNGNDPASMAGADANGDGEVDIMDLVFIINLIVNPPVSSGVRVDAAPGNTVSIEVPFHSAVPITALELTYTLSPGLTLVNAECSAMIGAGGEVNAMFVNVNGGMTGGTVTLELALQNDVTADQSVSVTAVTGANTAGIHAVGTPQTYVIDVDASALALLTQPEDTTVSVGNTATFTVEAVGPEPLAYQWYLNTNTGVGWLAVAGATESAYTTGAVAIGDDGFRYFCRVTAGESHLDSTAATLTVVAAPVTGDGSHPDWLIAVALLAAAGFAFALFFARRAARQRR